MKKPVLILAFAFIGMAAMHNAKAQTYDPLAVQRINDLIANNGLQATPNAPETWDFATWNDETPKQLIEIEMRFMGLRGDASFAGLTSLQWLRCEYNDLTKLDVTNCIQLQGLYCYASHLKEIVLSNCTQLKYLDFSYNFIKQINLASFTQLQALYCDANPLTELDLSGLNKLTDFSGDHQWPHVYLNENEMGEYTCKILLNNPTFYDSATISYSDGILKSTDKTLRYAYFTVQTNKEGFELSGSFNLHYFQAGIDSPENIPLKIYPNPTDGKLVINSGELMIVDVEIFDINGRRQKAEGRRQKAESEIVIDMSYLPAGIYFIKATTDKGDIVKKIVKQ